MVPMNNDNGEILIAVAHPSEEEAVRRAAAYSGCRCMIIVTGVGGAAMSWALQKRFTLGMLPGRRLPGTEPGKHLPGTEPGKHLPGTEPGKHLPGTEPGKHLPGTEPGMKERTASPARNHAATTLPSLVIGAGIAGSYAESIPPGTVVTTLSDCFADMGVDDNGHFIPLFGAGLADANTPPFSGGRIVCSGRWFDIAAGIMPAVRGATVNMASGSQAAIDRIRKAWDPEIETMEGAWLAYTCAMSGIPWVSVRAVSNMVEPRNLKNWNIPLALQNLQEKMIQLLELIAKS